MLLALIGASGLPVTPSDPLTDQASMEAFCRVLLAGIDNMNITCGLLVESILKQLQKEYPQSFRKKIKRDKFKLPKVETPEASQMMRG